MLIPKRLPAFALSLPFDKLLAKEVKGDDDHPVPSCVTAVRLILILPVALCRVSDG